MYPTPFYFSTIRKYAGAFGRLFANIKLQREDGSRVLVPLNYGPKRKWYVRATQTDQTNQYTGHAVALTLPRMSFEMNGMFYDPARKQSPLNQVRGKDPDADRLIRQFQAQPWTYTYEVAIITKNTDDGLRIVEQIVPFFDPQLTITVNEIPQLGISRDVPIIFNDISQDYDYEGTFDQRQTLMWTLNFSLMGYMYKPITDAHLIKKVNAYIHNKDPNYRIETQTTAVNPEDANEWDVDSNGEPTWTIEQTTELDSNGN